MPLAVRKAARACSAKIGGLIMEAFDLPRSKRVGELKLVIDQAIKPGEIEGGLEPEAYAAFLHINSARFGLADS